MLHLIRLERKKTNLGWYWKGAIIATLLIIAFMILISYIETLEGAIPFNSLEEALVVISATVRATFIVFAAVLLSKLIIEEYKNKTIFLAYSYPIQRKKLIAVKLFITSMLTFFTIVVSNIAVVSAFLLFNWNVQLIAESLTFQQYVELFISILTFAIASAGACLVPLYFGLRRQSVPATITASLIIVAITGQHNPAFSLATNIYIPIALAVIGVLIAYWAIRNVDRTDIF